MNLFHKAAVAVILLCLAPLATAVVIDPDAPNGEPQLLSLDDDRALITYKVGNGLYGKTELGGVVTPAFELMRGSTSISYSRHVSATRIYGGMSFIAAQRADAWVVPNVGTIPLYSIELVNLDTSNRVLNRRFIDVEAGVSKDVNPTELAIAARRGTEACCVALAWTDATRKSIEIERMANNLSSLDAHLRITSGSEDLRNPALSAFAAGNNFMLVYETRADIRVRQIPAVGTGLGPEIIVASKLRVTSASGPIDSKPAIAYSAILDAFMITWRDTLADGSRIVRAATVSASGTLPTTAFNVVRGCTGAWPSCLAEPKAVGAPRAAATPNGFTVVFAGKQATASYTDIAQYRIEMRDRATPLLSWRMLPTAPAGNRQAPALVMSRTALPIIAHVELLNLSMGRYSFW